MSRVTETEGDVPKSTIGRIIESPAIVKVFVVITEFDGYPVKKGGTTGKPIVKYLYLVYFVSKDIAFTQNLRSGAERVI